MRLMSAIALALLIMLQVYSCIAIDFLKSESEEYWMEKASYFSSRENYSLALMCINKSIEINSNNSNSWLIKGEILKEMDNHLESIESYDRAIQINPIHKEAWIGKASELLYSNNDEALKALNQAIELDSEDSDLWIEKAKCLQLNGDYFGAAKAYNEATRLDSKNPYLWRGKALFLKDLGFHDEAQLAYDQATELDPNNPGMWESKGEFLQGIERYEKAAIAYDQAIMAYSQFNPHPSFLWERKAASLRKIHRYDEAKRIVDQDKELKNAQYFENQRSYANAVGAYEKAIELGPQYLFLWKGKAISLWHSGRYYEAIFSYYKGLSIFQRFTILFAVLTTIFITYKRILLIRILRGKEELPSETLAQALSVFEGVKNPILYSFFRVLPFIIILAMVYCISQKGFWILIPGVLSLLLTFIAFQALLRRIPKVLSTLWHHHLIDIQHSSSQIKIEGRDTGEITAKDIETKYSNFVDEFETRLNGRFQWLFGLIFSVGWLGILISGFIIITELEEKMQVEDIHLVLGGFIGFIIGLMAWRMVVITYMVREIGKRFDLIIQFGNPDKCGGLEPLGNLCLWNSLIVSIPGLYIAGSFIAIGLIAAIYLNLNIDPFFDSETGKLVIKFIIFIIPALIIVFNFIISQRGIHKIMLSKRDEEWQMLSQQFDLVDQMAKRIFKLDKQDEAKRIEELESLQKMYISRKDQSYPTWPFNLSILAKFVTGIPLVIVPITAIIINLIDIFKET